jgi:pimeloyl-ACP methyl ester carboxylesterase
MAATPVAAGAQVHLHARGTGPAARRRATAKPAAGSAAAAPRLERERCAFKPPKGDRVECFVLTVLENREQPQGREIKLKVAILKAKRTAGVEPLVYLSGGPGDSPLVASTPGADALSEGDWWNETAAIRRRRDVVILSQRGAGGSSPNLDCFDTRSSDPAKGISPTIQGLRSTLRMPLVSGMIFRVRAKNITSIRWSGRSLTVDRILMVA